MLRVIFTILFGLVVLVLLHRFFGRLALSGGAVAYLGACAREIIAYSREEHSE